MNDALLRNHLTFLGRHRGEISRTAVGYAVRSTRAEFTYAVALHDVAVDANVRVVHRPDFGGAAADRLEAQGFRRAGALRYMARSTAATEHAPAAGVRVEIGSTLDDADVFADVQTAGFFDRADDQAAWRPFMQQAARRNILSPDQTFFVARVEDVPVGVTLTVRTEVVGIYAVATPTAFRNRGVATTLLDAALRRAKDAGFETATLQVAAGSPAERLYTRLGFEARFTTEIWQRG